MEFCTYELWTSFYKIERIYTILWADKPTFNVYKTIGGSCSSLMMKNRNCGAIGGKCACIAAYMYVFTGYFLVYEVYNFPD